VFCWARLPAVATTASLPAAASGWALHCSTKRTAPANQFLFLCSAAVCLRVAHSAPLRLAFCASALRALHPHTAYSVPPRCTLCASAVHTCARLPIIVPSHNMQACGLALTSARLLPMGSHPRVADKRSTYDLFGPVSKLWSTSYDRCAPNKLVSRAVNLMPGWSCDLLLHACVRSFTGP